MDTKRLIIYISIIVIILVAVFLSQQAYSREAVKPLISAAENQVQAYTTKGTNWIASKVTGEVQKRGDIIKNEVNQEKQKVSENIGTKIGNYFSGIANSIVHPGQTTNCPTPSQTQTN